VRLRMICTLLLIGSIAAATETAELRLVSTV
jgi:hypothetical protein